MGSKLFIGNLDYPTTDHDLRGAHGRFRGGGDDPRRSRGPGEPVTGAIAEHGLPPTQALAALRGAAAGIGSQERA